MFTYLIVWVQVLTEMLPISSSTHVELARRVWEYFNGTLAPLIPEGFDYLLHIPLLVVLPLFFRKGWWPLTSLLFKRIFLRQRLHVWSTRALVQMMIKIVGIIFISGVCAAGMQHLLKHLAVEGLRPLGLVVTGLFLVAAGRVRFSHFFSNSSMILGVMGAAQAMALLPGISRMGITVAVGLLMGLSARRAMQFSFALQYPLVMAAVLFRGLPWVLSVEARGWMTLTQVGNLIAAGVVSYGVLKAAEYLFARGRSWWFGCYLLVLGIVVFLSR